VKDKGEAVGSQQRKSPQLRLDELRVHLTLEKIAVIFAMTILMISRPSQREYPSRLLRGRTHQSFGPEITQKRTLPVAPA